MGTWQGLLLGMLGGVFVELYRLYEVRHRKRPDWFEDSFYWWVTGGMILAGGVLVVLNQLSGSTFTPLLAVQVGATAPLVVRKLIDRTEPPIPIDTGGTASDPP